MLISTLAAGHAKTVSTLSIPCQEKSFNLRNIKTRRYNFFAVTSQLPKQTEVRYFLLIIYFIFKHILLAQSTIFVGIFVGIAVLC